MSEPKTDLETIETLYDAAFGHHLRLCGSFNHLTAGNGDDAVLEQVIAQSLSISGMNGEDSLDSVLERLEPFYTGMTVAQAVQLVALAEAAQAHTQMLLLAPHEVLDLPENAEGATVENAIKAQVIPLQDGLVPYAFDFSRTLLGIAHCQPSSSGFQSDINAAFERREAVAATHEKLKTAIDAPGMRKVRCALWGWAIPHKPRAAFATNIERMAALHLEIAHSNMARISLRMTRASLRMNGCGPSKGTCFATSISDAFDGRLKDARQSFTATALHLGGGATRFGEIGGARQLIACRQSCRP